MKEEVERIQKRFRMKPHPEGGYFGAGSRSSEFIRREYLPPRYNGPRNLHSSIYFMVTPDSPSRFHKLKTDELWHFYAGDALELHLINDAGKYARIELSASAGSERFQYLVKRNTWIAASCNGERGFSLAGCSLAPGFEFDDFLMADPATLLKAFPDYEDIILAYT